MTRSLTPQLQLAAGYAHIINGGFLKEATPGASYSYPYVMATYVFLAEQIDEHKSQRSKVKGQGKSAR